MGLKKRCAGLRTDFNCLRFRHCNGAFQLRMGVKLARSHGGRKVDRMSENRVLRRIFGPKRNVVAGDWRKLHNEELYDLYSSPNISRVIKSRRMRWAGDRWEDNIKMDHEEMGCGRGGMDGINLAQDRDRWRVLLNGVMNYWFHKMRGVS